MKTSVVVLVLSISSGYGCGPSEPSQHSISAVAMPQPPQAPRPEEAVPAVPIERDTSYRVESHAARFKDDVLAECTDVVLSGNRPPDAPEDWAPPELPADDGDIVLQTNCDESFPDRVALGTCAFSRNGRHGESVIISGRFYLPEDVFDSDARMVECMRDVHGQWSSVDRRGPEAARARAERAIRAARELTER